MMDGDGVTEPMHETWGAAIVYLAEQVAGFLDPEAGVDREDDAVAFLDALDAATKPRGFWVASLVVRDGSELIVDEVPLRLDDELVAMKRCCDALDLLDEEGDVASRVVQYLVRRYEPEGSGA